jgi:hypothetical protein
MIIAISGKAGSGKNTLAQLLSESFKEECDIESFGSAVKDTVSAMFGYDRVKLEGTTIEDRNWREQEDPIVSSMTGRSFTPRQALIFIGTDIGRNAIHPDFWIETLFKKYHQRLANSTDNNIMIITDLRFKNEYSYLKKVGAILIRINRDAHISSSHITECDLDDQPFDYFIDNNGSLEDLKIKTSNLAKSINYSP